MYTTLIDPPCEFALKGLLLLLMEDLQLVQGALLTTTLKPLAIVASHKLLLLEDSL
jgi:hypothetical protein